MRPIKGTDDSIISEVGLSHFLRNKSPINLIKSNIFKMNETLKRHLISAGTTFISTFLVTIAVAISSTGYTFTKEALLSLGVAGVVAGARAIAKLIIEWNTGTIS